MSQEGKARYIRGTDIQNLCVKMGDTAEHVANSSPLSSPYVEHTARGRVEVWSGTVHHMKEAERHNQPAKPAGKTTPLH